MYAQKLAITIEFLLTYIQKCNTLHTFAMRKDNSFKSTQHAVTTQQITSHYYNSVITIT